MPSVGQPEGEMVLPRKFLRTCRANMRRMKIADTSGAELTGASLLMRALIVRRLLRREVLTEDEKHVGLLMPPSVGTVVSNAALAIDRRTAGMQLAKVIVGSSKDACIVWKSVDRPRRSSNPFRIASKPRSCRNRLRTAAAAAAAAVAADPCWRSDARAWQWRKRRRPY